MEFLLDLGLATGIFRTIENNPESEKWPDPLEDLPDKKNKRSLIRRSSFMHITNPGSEKWPNISLKNRDRIFKRPSTPYL